ncbi:hypothetical protein K488DRAFT_64257, partial [Vararia minispora EC-137]
PYVLRPFNETEVAAADPALRHRMTRFNVIVSGVRSCVEQAFGILKGRFPSLKCLGTPVDINDTYRAFEALVAIHNYCINVEDHYKKIPEFDRRDPVVEEAIREIREAVESGEYGQDWDNIEKIVPGFIETPDTLREAGYQMRQTILDALVPP